LKYLFKAITRILATVCPPISALLFHSDDPKVQQSAIVVSTLGQAAAIFCVVDSSAFLEHIVPREAQIAQKKLERFHEALDIMGLERHMRQGRRVTLYGPDPAAVAEEWRDVAEQYQSVLPDDRDPAF
jgi:hypothetical protein